jgi:TRAP-type C4-dicarboxylate transport system permease large subunit
MPAALGTDMAGLGLGAHGTLVMILLAYVVLDMFLDGLAVLVITLSIFFPIITGLDFDAIWFGVVVVIVIEMGMITPPGASTCSSSSRSLWTCRWLLSSAACSRFSWR